MGNNNENYQRSGKREATLSTGYIYFSLIDIFATLLMLFSISCIICHCIDKSVNIDLLTNSTLIFML